jgi:type 1 glutamine amidotransferase
MSQALAVALTLLTLPVLATGALAADALAADKPAAGVVYAGTAGPGQGKHIVLVAGDEEYRSEEALPQLAKILARHHGFKCTVLFSVDPEGNIDPNKSDIPGLEALESADLLVLFTRFRDLPDEQMQHLVDYIESGRPIIGIRTATHAFNTKSEKFGKYTWTSKVPGYEQGFGRQVLGETWISHHGQHGRQSTRGLIAKGQENHPILRGIKDGDIWGPTDVYGVRLPLPGDSQPLVLGQVLTGMKFDDPPAEGKVNDPLMPIAWTKTYTGAAGKPARVFTSTIGAANDLTAEGTRRLLVNACFWGVGLEEKIPERSNVELVGDYQPSNFRNDGFKKGVKPADLELK